MGCGASGPRKDGGGGGAAAGSDAAAGSAADRERKVSATYSAGDDGDSQTSPRRDSSDSPRARSLAEQVKTRLASKALPGVHVYHELPADAVVQKQIGVMLPEIAHVEAERSVDAAAVGAAAAFANVRDAVLRWDVFAGDTRVYLPAPVLAKDMVLATCTCLSKGMYPLSFDDVSELSELDIPGKMRRLRAVTTSRDRNICDGIVSVEVCLLSGPPPSFIIRHSRRVRLAHQALRNRSGGSEQFAARLKVSVEGTLDRLVAFALGQAPAALLFVVGASPGSRGAVKFAVLFVLTVVAVGVLFKKAVSPPAEPAPRAPAAESAAKGRAAESGAGGGLPPAAGRSLRPAAAPPAPKPSAIPPAAPARHTLPVTGTAGEWTWRVAGGMAPAIVAGPEPLFGSPVQRAPDRVAAAKCLRGKHVALFGDSLLRYQYMALSQLVDASMPPTRPLVDRRVSHAWVSKESAQKWQPPNIPLRLRSLAYEKEWAGGWTEYFDNGTRQFDGRMCCDCWRMPPGRESNGNLFATNAPGFWETARENRFLVLPGGLKLSFFFLHGNHGAHGATAANHAACLNSETAGEAKPPAWGPGLVPEGLKALGRVDAVVVSPGVWDRRHTQHWSHRQDELARMSAAVEAALLPGGKRVLQLATPLCYWDDPPRVKESRRGAVHKHAKAENWTVVDAAAALRALKNLTGVYKAQSRHGTQSKEVGEVCSVAYVDNIHLQPFVYEQLNRLLLAALGC
eukprot:TRINITY_DN9861_c0_g1_i3.p1 TRINITY_DN9861_c0_g1~~TRINITY_DN9861_c0_g1_i3.p1  ORF type:complete len:737 (+),score=211.04 TRINITY_DN9861_c0_g1_i3:64-2274(+)